MDKKFLFTRVGYSYLPTADIDNTILWYTEKLGLKFINKFEDRGSLIAIIHYPHKNAIAVVLVETSDQAPLKLMRNGSEYPVLSMNCQDIEYTHQCLKDKGVDVGDIHSLGEEAEAKYFYFKDDQGNLLEAAWSQWDVMDEIRESFL